MQFRFLGRYWSFSRTTFWVRGERGAWMLKFPNNWPPLFSERYGHWKHRRLLGYCHAVARPQQETGNRSR